LAESNYLFEFLVEFNSIYPRSLGVSGFVLNAYRHMRVIKKIYTKINLKQKIQNSIRNSGNRIFQNFKNINSKIKINHCHHLSILHRCSLEEFGG
jgi:hypothetical protein